MTVVMVMVVMVTVVMVMVVTTKSWFTNGSTMDMLFETFTDPTPLYMVMLLTCQNMMMITAVMMMIVIV